MTYPATVFSNLALASVLGFALSACGSGTSDDEGNVLPTATASASTSATDTGDTGNAGMGVPATYRFTCIDIQQAGSAGDGDIQTNLLQDTWAGDISGHRLNILVDFLTLDDTTGEATMQIRSGIGPNNSDQCAEPNSDSTVLPVTYDANETAWAENTAVGTCSQPAEAGASSFGTFNVMTAPSDVVYIYAEDDSGNAFNCTDNPQPDAVPIHAIEASFTLSEDEQIAHGSLTGCLVESEAETICSCLGTCVPPSEPHPNCGCNPDALPLRELLLGVTETQRCTDLMGETAFDVQIAFSAQRLVGIPETCG